jgi:pseudouridine-5'-phosphate glycosidase/pseudouridine kinase
MLQSASVAHFVSERNPYIKVSEEVREAISDKKPVVALETTIYTHGRLTNP